MNDDPHDPSVISPGKKSEPYYRRLDRPRVMVVISRYCCREQTPIRSQVTSLAELSTFIVERGNAYARTHAPTHAQWKWSEENGTGCLGHSDHSREMPLNYRKEKISVNISYMVE